LAGDGAPPNGCNGEIQTFVITGGRPPFTVGATGGCISASSVPESPGTVLYTAGSTPGNYTITVTDAVGRTTTINVKVQGPPTPTVPPTATLSPAASMAARTRRTASPSTK
jgi:hypothetical protein